MDRIEFFRRSMAGLMAVTAFLSMWINNSAAASIMLPVALAISNEIGRHGIETEQNHITDKERSVKMNGKGPDRIS